MLTGALLALVLQLHVEGYCRKLPDGVCECAPIKFSCRACPTKTRVYLVAEGGWQDPFPFFVDHCGHTHTHDGSFELTTLICAACGRVWDETETRLPCWCGWTRDDHGEYRCEP